MQLNTFRIERYFAEHEFTAQHLLSASDCESIALPDLLALADAVREVGFTWDAPGAAPAATPTLTRRKGHLGVVADPGEPLR